MYHDLLTRVVEKEKEKRWTNTYQDQKLELLQWSDGDSHSNMDFVHNLKEYEPVASPNTSHKLNFGSLQKA